MGPERRRQALFLWSCGAVVLLGLALQWPSLSGGFRGDDYVQAAMYRGEFAAPRGPLDLFSFAAGTPADYERLVDFGHLPWWSHPQLRLRMWRPLASALMALDFELFGSDARLHHAHSLLWFVLLLIAAGRLLWRVLPPWSAAIACLMFASGPCHTLPIGWLANRSTLVACTFAFLALELLVRARETRSCWPRIGCAAASCVALLCGEYALSALGYGVCLGLFGGRENESGHGHAYGGKWLGRVISSLPVLGPMAGYLVLHSALGSDIVHSGYYISPFRAPLDFLGALFTRVPVLTADLLFGMPSYYYHAGSPWRGWLLSKEIIPPEIWLRLPDWKTWHVLIGYLAIAFGALLYGWLRRQPDAERPPAWLVLGTLLSLLPCAGSLPEDRLLTAATLGSCALIACALATGARSMWRARRLSTGTVGTLTKVGAVGTVGKRRAARVAQVALWLLALWVPASALSRSFDDVREIRVGSEVARAWCLDAQLPSHDAAGARVYVVSTADFNTAVNLPWLRLLEANHPVPLSYRRLSPGPMPVLLQRESERAFLVRVVTSDVYGSAVPALYRDAGAPVFAGERHALPGMNVEVLEAYDGNPIVMRFELDRPLEDPQLWFLAATGEGLRRLQMPAIGERTLIPYAQYRDLRKAAQ